MALPTQKLGKNGPQVNQLGFGTMGLSAFYGPPKPDSERFAVLDAAYDNGERFWDSADIYMDSEDLLGKWFKANPDKRDNIFLATKFAIQSTPDGSRTINTTPEYVKEAIEKSLKRLGLPYVDLYYAHRLDQKTPVEHTVQAMAELQKQGKIKYIGLSECSADSLRRACKIAHVDAVQVEYSPFTMDIEKPQVGLLQACRDLGVAVIAYSPIGRGMLSGEIKSREDFDKDDFRLSQPRFSEENFPKNLELVEKIKAIASNKKVTPSQLTLAWLMAQGPDIFPIPGTTRIDRLKENIGSTQIKLSDTELKEIRAAIDATEPAGLRYGEAMMPTVFADTPLP